MSGMTCWRRLHEWHQAGVWSTLHRNLLNELGLSRKIDWARAAIDATSVRALRGGDLTGPNPTDRAKAGSKQHLIVDMKGHPLAMALSAANVNEVTVLLPLVDAIPPVKGPRGRPRRRPRKLHADKAYESRSNRRGLRARHIAPRIARKGIEPHDRLGRYRWVVEQRIAVLHQLRKLRVRDERRGDIHFALLVLGCDLMLFQSLARF